MRETIYIYGKESPVFIYEIFRAEIKKSQKQMPMTSKSEIAICI